MFTNKNCSKKIWKHYPELSDEKPFRYDRMLLDTGLCCDYDYKISLVGSYWNSLTVLFNRSMSCDLYNVFGCGQYAKMVEQIFQFKNYNICEADIFYGRPFKIKENDDALKKYIQTYFREYDDSVIRKFCVYFITNTAKTKNIVDYLEMKNVCGGDF